MFLDFEEGGLKIPNLKTKFQALYLSHLQKLICESEAKWTYFAKYWIGLQLRKFNPSFACNNFPHSEYVPMFYKECLSSLELFLKICPNHKFGNTRTKTFYNFLLTTIIVKPKILTLCPNINFKSVWKNIYSPSIDPRVCDTMYRISHDVIYVNYYLYCKGISKDKLCPICSKTETVSHLFLECTVFLPLNKLVLFLLRKFSKTIIYSEKLFRYCDLPNLNRSHKYLSLILLSESRQMIWTCRNLKRHENKHFDSAAVINRFVSKLKLRILADKKRLASNVFDDIWLKNNFCAFDGNRVEITFDPLVYTVHDVQSRIINT